LWEQFVVSYPLDLHPSLRLRIIIEPQEYQAHFLIPLPRLYHYPLLDKRWILAWIDQFLQ
jgi:hypothetical protein